MPETPSVGRIVHYVAYGTPGGEFPTGCHRAAIITEVESSISVDLCVLNPTGFYFLRGAVHSDDHRPGTWHWPERTHAS